jgi:protein involved in polysaccharide export with SLBB domain
MSESAIMEQLRQKGLPASEVDAFTTRINGLMSAQNKIKTEENKQGKLDRTNSKESDNNQAENEGSETATGTSSKVFGSELFSSAKPIFVPNLNIATPPNYMVGPGDELNLEIFGANLSSQKVLVSREGFINVKYAGLINVNGSTISDLNTLLKSKLVKYYPSLSSGSSKLQISLGAIRSIHITIVGAVKKPGTLTISSLATLFNALYACGGPQSNGSFRNIELIRNNKPVLIADLYDFLLKGDQSANVFLQEGDLIRVPFATLQVGINGEVNRSAIYEMKPTENLSKLLEYAGGFTSNAYKARVLGTRNNDLIREVLDIPATSYDNFTFKHGDDLVVSSIVDKFLNKVTIQGEVYKPGTYSWRPGMQLLELINKAEGLTLEAYQNRIVILRTTSDFRKEAIDVDLRKVVKGTESYELQKEDIVSVSSVIDQKDKFTVIINGPVRKPGYYNYADSLTLQSLILQAGGFTSDALPISIEVGRRKKEIGINVKGAPTAEIITVKMTTDLSKLGADFLLEPYDIVSIKTDPAKVPQISVRVSGQVLYPGSYVLESRAERLSKVVARAGGLLPYADIKGARLIRKSTAADTATVEKIVDRTFETKRRKDSIDLTATAQDFTTSKMEIAVNIQKVLSNPGSDNDIVLEDGDEIIFPAQSSVVSVGGEVLKAIAVQYIKGYHLKKYVSSAGGFSNNANKRKSFVVYTNGNSKRTKQFLGIFRKYPEIEPGSTVVVPAKPVRSDKKFDPAKAGILISALSTVATTLVLLFK